MLMVIILQCSRAVWLFIITEHYCNTENLCLIANHIVLFSNLYCIMYIFCVRVKVSAVNSVHCLVLILLWLCIYYMSW